MWKIVALTLVLTLVAARHGPNNDRLHRGGSKKKHPPQGGPPGDMSDPPPSGEPLFDFSRSPPTGPDGSTLPPPTGTDGSPLPPRPTFTNYRLKRQQSERLDPPSDQNEQQGYERPNQQQPGRSDQQQSDRPDQSGRPDLQQSDRPDQSGRPGQQQSDRPDQSGIPDQQQSDRPGQQQSSRPDQSGRPDQQQFDRQNPQSGRLNSRFGEAGQQSQQDGDNKRPPFAGDRGMFDNERQQPDGQRQRFGSEPQRFDGERPQVCDEQQPNREFSPWSDERLGRQDYRPQQYGGPQSVAATALNPIFARINSMFLTMFEGSENGPLSGERIGQEHQFARQYRPLSDGPLDQRPQFDRSFGQGRESGRQNGQRPEFDPQQNDQRLPQSDRQNGQQGPESDRQNDQRPQSDRQTNGPNTGSQYNGQEGKGPQSRPRSSQV